MGNFILQITGILNASAGNLTFYLLLALPVLAALLAVLAVQKASRSANPRLLLGLLVLLTAQVLLFVISLLAWLGVADPQAVLPPLERAVTSFGLVWVIWLWGFPKPSKAADTSAVILSLTLLGVYLFTLAAWNNLGESSPFNGTSLEWTWQGISILFAGAGLLILLIRRPSGWGFGAAMLLLSLAGAILHLAFGPVSVDYPGAVRLFQLAAYAFLPALAHRSLGETGLRKTAPPPDEPEYETAQPKVDSRALNAWLELLQNDRKISITEATTKAVGISMQADLCYLVSLQKDNGEITFRCGYDLLKEEYLPGFSLGKNELPAIHSALQDAKPFQWGADAQNLPDFKTLATVTGLEKPDHLLLVPWGNRGQVQWGILLLSPYSQKGWDTDDHKVLTALYEALNRLLGSPQAPPAPEPPEQHARRAQDIAPKAEPPQPRVDEKTASQIEGLITVQKELQSIIENLQTENDQLRETLENSASRVEKPANLKGVETELKMALKEVAHLQNALAAANLKVLNLGSRPSRSPIAPLTMSAAEAIIQDIRKPMASVIGYCDLLLTESVGILGDMQMKFLERIKNYIEQINPLLSKLENIQASETHQPVEHPEAVSVPSIIDNALLEIAAQIREKNITLRINLQDMTSEIYTNPDTLQQIVANLLQNACDASPMEGTIDLQVRHQADEKGLPNLIIHVTDSGGGTAYEDLSKLFSQPSQAGGQPAQPADAFRARLATAQSLTEAQGGRIWAESDPGKSTTYHILLPAYFETAVPNRAG